MKKIFLYILPISLLIINSCKKNILPPGEAASSSPVFYFKGYLNGVSVNMDAGVNDYYMYASYSQNPNSGVYEYKANLKQSSCENNCGYALSILINDSKVYQSDAKLEIGKHEFNDSVLPPLSYVGSFTPSLSYSSNTYTWTYSDGSKEINPLYGIVSHTFANNKTYSVSLTMKENNNPDLYTHTNVFKIGNPLQLAIALTGTTYPTYAFSVTPSVTVNYNWNFGDMGVANSSNPSHTYASEGYYTTKLIAWNTTDTCVSYYQVSAFSSQRPNANYRYLFTPQPNTNALSAVTIKLIDPSGIEYSSALINQSADSKLEILSVEEYKKNELGQLTKKVKIKFNCAVVNGSSTIKINNAEAVVAVSYK